jgi:hypothetical protein
MPSGKNRAVRPQTGQFAQIGTRLAIQRFMLIIYEVRKISV